MDRESARGSVERVQPSVGPMVPEDVAAPALGVAVSLSSAAKPDSGFPLSWERASWQTDHRQMHLSKPET